MKYAGIMLISFGASTVCINLFWANPTRLHIGLALVGFVCVAVGFALLRLSVKGK